MTSSYTPSALEFAVWGPDRGNWRLQALAWERVPAWACRPDGRGGRSGLVSEGLAHGRGSSLGLDFWKEWQFIINY
jgi:hypothetical protein